MILAFDTKNMATECPVKEGERVALWAKPESRYLYGYHKDSGMGDGYLGRCKVPGHVHEYFSQKKPYKSHRGTMVDGLMVVNVIIDEKLLRKPTFLDKLHDFLT